MKKPSDLISLLNQTLQLEYTLIIHYPRIASAINDEKISELALKLGSDSIKHADTVARAIVQLGGTPTWSFEPFTIDDNISNVFVKQLEKEKLAAELHEKTSELARDPQLKNRLHQLTLAEYHHIQIVQDILARLK